MNIFIDESGSFVGAERLESWNVVVALAAPEIARRGIDQALKRLKYDAGANGIDEVKLHQVSDASYLRFVRSLGDSSVVLFATATDAGLNTSDLVLEHQRVQVAKIRENIPRMKHEGGRAGVGLLADQLEALAPQLYVQLMCQVNLLHDVISRAITYYSQRCPATLGEFRWRIDQKNTSRTVFEETFEKIAPPLLQSRSLREPIIRVREFDYRRFAKYEFEDGKVPEYLAEEYGLEVREGINVGKLLRDNLKCEDSNSSLGIQAADLLASGLRRCLRGKFADTDAVAAAIGRLTLQNERDKHAIDLISLGQVATASADVTRIVHVMTSASRALIERGRGSATT